MIPKCTEHNRKWWILAAMTTTISMIFIDISVLPVVLPTLQREMLISDLGLQWILNAYTLALAVLVLAGGKIGDMWGMKKAFCGGTISFALASALCGLSLSEEWLIFSRALQGVGGALLLPATQGIILSHFPPHQRGKALGLFVSVGSVFLALGPLIGGFLTTWLSWRYVFWINLPIAAAGLLLALYTVPPMTGKKERFDLGGFFILGSGIGALVIALMQSQEWGWSSPATLLLFAIGCACMFLLFHRRNEPQATIPDFTLMRKRAFIAASGCIFCNQVITMVAVFWAIYFQNILGFSASSAGAFSFLANIPVLIAAPLGGFMVDRFGPRVPVMTGFGLICFSLVWFITFVSHQSILELIPTLLTFGFGIPMVYTPGFVALMNEIPTEKRGAASGITSALRQFSASVGLALFGTIYSSLFIGHLGQSLQNRKSTMKLDPRELEGLLSQSPNALKITEALPPADAGYVLASAKAAFLDGFSWINLVGAIVALLGMFIAWKMLKNTPVHRGRM